MNDPRFKEGDHIMNDTYNGVRRADASLNIKNEAFEAARKLIAHHDDRPHVAGSERYNETSTIEELEIASDAYLHAADMLREACVTAPGLDVAGIVLMADHYRARGLAQKAFVHSVRCRPDFDEIARRSGVRR